MTTKKLTDYIKQSISTQSTKKEEQPKPAQARIRFKKETELQETPIGKIPKEWKVVKLSDVAEIRGNKSINKVNKIAFIPMELIPDSGVFVRYEIRDLDDVSSFTYCEAGDILLAKITPSFENGKQGIVPDDVPNRFALTTTEVYPIACKQVNRLFLFYILKHPKFRKILEHSMRGTTGRRRVPRDALENLEMPIPPLFEQKVIAEILSTVDLAIDRVRRLVERAEKLKKGLMQELFTKGIGHKEFKETPIGRVPNEWLVYRLGQLAIEMYYGVTAKAVEHSTGTRFLRTTDIKDYKVQWNSLPYCEVTSNNKVNLSKYTLRKGDIIVSRAGTVGMSVYVDRDMPDVIFGSYLIKIRVNDKLIDPKFLHYYLQTEQYWIQILASSKGSTLKNISLPTLKSLVTPVPTLEEQKVIIEILSTVDRYVESIKMRLERLERVKKWLMDVLLTGKVRVMVEPSSGGSSG
ncbi:MAG: restriction endonuclease subunit S [Desulfurococcaceae archaeon]